MFLHYDMDSFYASIEKRDNPLLKDKAIVVGKSIVTTASYEARKYGINSTMNIVVAKEKCNELVIIEPRVDYYSTIGHMIREYISRFFLITDYISSDEGFIDITSILEKRYENRKIYTDDEKKKEILNFANLFKEKISKKFNLPLSVGIGETKLISKMATDFNKPNGVFLFYNQDEFINYVIDKKIGIFHGIGKKTSSHLMSLGIITTRDLLKKDKQYLKKVLGSNRGIEVYNIIRGNYNYENNIREHNKSIAKEKTYFNLLNTIQEILDELREFSKYLADELREENKYIQTITLKIKYSDFSIITKSKTFDEKINLENEIYDRSKKMFYSIKQKSEIRLLGLTVSKFSNKSCEYLKIFKI